MKLFNNKIYYYFVIVIYYGKNIFYYFPFILFFCAYLLQIFSLEKCYQGFDLCSLKTKWIERKVFEAIISSLILVVLLEFIFYKILSILHLLHIILFYIIVFIYSHGIDFDDHGYYNVICSISLIMILILLISPLNCIVYLVKLNNKIYIYIFILTSLIIFGLYLLFSNYYINCNEWKYGLNNSFIENDNRKYKCQIRFPKNCPYKIGKYIFDNSKNNKTICNEKIDTKKKIIESSESKFINSETKRIAYPLPNKNKKIHKVISLNSDEVMKFYKNNLIDLDNQDLVHKVLKNNNPEIIIDYTNNSFGDLIIDLQYNKTLSEERKQFEINSTPYSNNLIVLFIDSVSRAYSMRSLKKTLKFFEKFMSYKGSHNDKYPSENFHSFQFFKFHSFGYYTRYNYPPVFYGKIKGKLVRNIKYLKENGYVTCYINDMCHREPTNTGHNMTDEEISDHEMLICDPNMKHVFSSSKRCLYNKITASYALEYGEQFWKKYSENRKYLSINLEDGHEGTMEVLKYADNIIYNFFQNLYENNLLKSTSIFLISDHGTHSPSPYYTTEFYHIERFLPMFYLICNDRKNISYEEQYYNINKNQQTLITGYDIYNTIGNLVFGDKYYLIKNKTEENETPKTGLGISLFNKINALERSPKNYLNMTNKVCVVEKTK